MKRFHVSISVANLNRSIEFYSTLFGVEPILLKDDYAKWMLEDPRINFAISQSNNYSGVNHIGLQADTMDELEAIQSRLRDAQEKTFDQPDAQCCYANSSKTWVRDPDDVAWETFVTHGQITHHGDDRVPAEADSSNQRCCV
jgi:catechol 2,3-dioxygenase-like lactoylglutathione lyase family enzyme